MVENVGYIFQNCSDRRYVLGLLLVSSCYTKRKLEIFISVKILVENISKFNVYWNAVICHYILSTVRYKKSNKFLLLMLGDKVTCLSKVFISYTTEKIKLMWNSSLIRYIFNFTKTIFHFYIFKGNIFKFFYIYKFFI